MEKKQLNFSAPIMSARRYSSPIRPSGEDKRWESPIKDRKAIPSERPNLNSDEVVKPGSVPFMWEQAPGKAKGGTGSEKSSSPDELPSTPKLPPGRVSGELNGYRTPNKLSGELVVLRQRSKLSGELNVVRPYSKFSGELNTLSLRHPKFFSGELNTLRSNNKISRELHTLSKFYSMNDGMARWDSSKDETEMDASSDQSENDDDATFSDAHESFSLNCSVSGLSESERPDTKPSGGIISTDAKDRGFMMDRFLPAAKAMTLEPSQYASKRQLATVEQPKEVKALVPRAKTPPPSQNVCNIVPYTGQDIGSEESEDEDDSYDEHSAISVKIKACGFLPWFCSKNSLRIFNPLPSLKHKSKTSASKVSNLVKIGSWKTPSPKLSKHVSCNSKHKVDPVYKSCELQKPKPTSRPMFYSGELQTRSGSPYRSSRRSSVSPYRNGSPHTLYQRGVGYLAVPKRIDPYDDHHSKRSQKGSRRFEELKRNKRGSGTRSPAVEKTLYIDPVNITKVSHTILNLSKNKRQGDALTNEHGPVNKSGLVQDVAKSEAVLQYERRMEIMKARGMSGPLPSRSADIERPSKPSNSPKLPAKTDANTCRDLVLVSDDTAAIQSSLTPPLPKSPSESWLSRKLPSVSPRNSVSYSSLNSKLQSRKQGPKTPTSGPKWETIVKSSHMRHDYGRYSEELVTHVPQRPRAWK